MDGAAGSPRDAPRGRKGTVANEDGLRALAERIENGNRPNAPGGAATSTSSHTASNGSRGDGRLANEAGLLALGERMRQASGTPVANQAGLLALAEQIDRAGARATGTNTQPADPGVDGGASDTTIRALQEDGAPAHTRHRHSRPRSRRRVWLRRGLLGGLAFVVLLVVGGGGYLYYLTHDLNRIHVRGLEGALTSGREAGTENILMVGSTSRCSLAVQNPAYGLCSEGVNGVNSDVVMVLHVDPTHHHLALLSIPRDLFVPNARSEGPNKIDAGLYEGVSQVVASVEEDFGIPIQHAVTLNFDQFANVVDALGGINMSFPMSVFDAESGLNVQAAACVHLNGTQALSVVRARHLQYRLPTTVSNDAFYWPKENLSDLARIRRDHEFLRVLGSAAAHRGLGNPISDLDLINSVKADLSFDENWPVSDMANLVLDFHSVDPNSVPQLTIPVSVVVDPQGGGGGLLYRAPGGVIHNYGDAEFPSQAGDQAVIQQVLGIDAGTDSMTGNPLPAPSTVAVSVVNGSGVADQATTTAAALAGLGFHTVSASDQPPAGDVTETVVYYGSRSPQTEAAAEAVARSLSGAVIMGYDPTRVMAGSEVTVVTGSDFAVNPPAPAPTTTAHGATSSSTAATTPAPAPTTTATVPPSSVTSGAIQPPSPPSTALEPWDPRACPAGAAPTAPVANLT